AVHDGELAFIPDLLQRSHVVRNGIVLVERNDLAFRNADRAPVILVQPVVVGDHRVEVIVAARELEYDQHGILLSCCHCSLLQGRSRWSGSFAPANLPDKTKTWSVPA